MKKTLFVLFLLFNLTLSAKNKTWTCINEKGQIVFTIEAIRVYEFHSGLAKVYKNTLVNNKWITGYGFINTKGEVVIDCKLKEAKDFNGPVTWVKYEGSDYYTLIDKQGNRIPAKNYKKVGYTYDSQKDVFAVYENDKMGFINAEGKEIIPCKYIGSECFTEGLASVCKYDSDVEVYGFINKKGEAVIPLKFRQAGTSSFHNGLARAKVAGKTVLINTKGETVFKTTKGNIQGHNHGLVLLITKPNRKGWGWVNFKDEFVINPVYDHANNFTDEGYAIVEKNGLKGLIDTTGKLVLDFKYETIYADYTEDGYYMGVYPSNEPKSLFESEKDYFDANFNLINTSQYLYISSAENSTLLPFYDKSEKIGYLNRQFEQVIPARYTKAEAFSEGLAWVRF